MSPAAPYVRAVVVTTGPSEYLAETLASLASQSSAVDSSHLVVCGGPDDDRDLDLPPGVDVRVTHARARTFGEAVSALLESVPEEEGEWLWLLHDDSAPEHDALERLVAQAGKRRIAGVVGSAQVRWDNPFRLVNVGTTVSRWASRRLNFAEGDDLDQGQHDAREDVLAVGLAGALVTRAVWTRLEGTDPAYGAFGDSADFCRRAWRAGYDVVIAPGARVRHAQRSLYGRSLGASDDPDPRSSHAARRAGEWYHALAWGPAWFIPVLLLWSVLAAVGRAALRVAANDPALVVAELRSPIVLAGRLGRLGASRARVRRASKGGQAVEWPLLASPGDVLRSIRTRELGAYEAWRAENTPTDVQRSELRAIAVRRRWALAALSLVMLGVSVALFGTWYAPLARGDMLTGAALGSTDLSAADLWSRCWTGWSEIGFGSGATDGAFAALMLPLAFVPGGLAMGLGMVLLLSPLLGALTAWFAAGAVTRSLVARATAAVLWGTWPVLVQAVSDGRVGAVVAHLLLPVFAVTLIRSVGLQRRDRLADGAAFPANRVGSPTAASAAALTLVALSVAAPILLLPLAMAAIAVGLGSRGHRRYALTVPLPALIVHGAVLWQVRSSGLGEGWWLPLVREDGPALASVPASGWNLLFGIAQPPPEWPGITVAGNVVLTYLVGILAVSGALVALASGRASGAVAVGWAVAGVGLAIAAVAQRTVAVAGGPDGTEAANGWPGPGLTHAALGLVGAACAAAPPGWSPGANWRAHPVRTVGGSALIALVAVHVAGTVWPGREFGGDVHPASSEVLPLVASLEQQSQPRSRVLVMWDDGDGGVRYSVESGDGATSLEGRGPVVRGEGGPDTLTPETIAPAVAALAGDGSGAAALVGWGIGTVVVDPGSTALASAVLRSEELSLIGASDRGWTWRVIAPDGQQASRAWIQTALGARVPLDNDPTGIAASLPPSASGRVILAVPRDDRWWATLDGVPLPVADADGRQAFAIERGGGELRVGFSDPVYRRWWWFSAVALLWAAASAIPLHDRRFRRTAR